CASNPSPSRNQPSNWWPRAQRSVNKIIDTTSEPCVVLGSSRYLQSATANAKEHAIALVLDGPLYLGQPLFAADQARWSCARPRGRQWPAYSPASRLRICRVRAQFASLKNPSEKAFNALDMSNQQMITAILIDYAFRMGVDPRFIAMASATPPNSMYYLNKEELELLKVNWRPKDFEPWSIEPSGKGVIAFTKQKAKKRTE